MYYSSRSSWISRAMEGRGKRASPFGRFDVDPDKGFFSSSVASIFPFGESSTHHGLIVSFRLWSRNIGHLVKASPPIHRKWAFRGASCGR